MSKQPDESCRCGSKCGTRVISGVVEVTNASFRPRSWAQRLAELLARTPNRVPRYAECLQPADRPDGTQELRVNTAMAVCRPEVYRQVNEFAKANDLQVRDEE